jgi:glucokinase
VLVADVGATTTRVALVAGDPPSPSIIKQVALPSREHAGLDGLLRHFLEDVSDRPRDAVLAVAGPVMDGRAELTNLGWTLVEESLAAALGLRTVRLVNDLFAMASALPVLDSKAIFTLQREQPAARGPLALIAPGTGLGQAYLTWHDGDYKAHPSEGGHADFAPNNRLQDDLLQYLRSRYGHVSGERVCSGRALPELYDFLKSRGPTTESPDVASRLAAAPDRTPVIIEAGLSSPRCPLCRSTLELFADLLAAEAGNLALRVLATGGVYLGGGLPRRLLPLLRRPEFVVRFREKGRLAPVLARMPVHVIVQPNVGLLGAIRCAGRQPK